MQTTTMVFKLAKTLAALAWADGEMDASEINIIKGILFKLDELSAEEWAELDIYLDHPISAEECEHLVEDLLGSIHSRSDKEFVIETFRHLIEADGQVTDEEQELFDELSATINGKSTGPFAQLSRLLIACRSKTYKKENTREKYLAEFMSNKVLYDFKHQGNTVGMDEVQMNKACAAAALLGRLSHEDGDFSQVEKDILVERLEADWYVSRSKAQALCEIVTQRSATDMDYENLMYHFFEMTTAAERKNFILSLFKLAAACQELSFEEVERIRHVASCIRVQHPDFIWAKLQVLES
jgi:uncharacterized tellurite resistance protein B-like protein